MKTNGVKKSFHDHRNVKMAIVASAGVLRGRIRRVRIWNVFAPSMRAASSSSIGIVVKNCRETMAGRPGTNEPYEKYMGHDNNRDSYMMNGIDSRVRQRVWREWEPDIIYVHHQSSPFPTRIWIPPFADPVGLRAPAIPAREIIR